jgi:hypothetical protein
VLLTNFDLTPSGGGDVNDCRTPPAFDPANPESALAAGTINARQFASQPDCTGVLEGDWRLATAALLSARFPFVSPTGQMPRCEVGTAAPVDQIYTGDGGYLENSGLHSLLALWADTRPWVEQNNSEGNHPNVIPALILIDNHFRSTATLAARPKLDELAAPVKAPRRGLIDQPALELAARAVFAGDVPGLDKSDPHPAQRWFVLAPSDRPQVAAPLGWSLSDTATESLRCQLDWRLLKADDHCADKPPLSPEVDELVKVLSPVRAIPPPRSLRVASFPET